MVLKSIYAVHRLHGDTKRRLTEYMESLDAHGSFSHFRFLDPDHLHLSLASTSVEEEHVPDAKARILRMMKKKRPFRLRNIGIDYPKKLTGKVARRANRIWALFEPDDDIVQFRDMFDDSLRLYTESPKSKRRRPHVTLAYGIPGVPLPDPSPEFPLYAYVGQGLLIDTCNLEISNVFGPHAPAEVTVCRLGQ